MVVGSNNKLLRTLEKHREHIDPEEFETNVKSHRIIYDDLIENRRGTFVSTVERSSKFTESYLVQPTESHIITGGGEQS